MVIKFIINKNTRHDETRTILLDKIVNCFKSINCEYCQIDSFVLNETAKIFYYKKCKLNIYNIKRIERVIIL